jgi:hypothetical protein
MIERQPDWDQRLHDYLASAANRQHEWGKHDCMLHCAGAIKAVTGKDLGRGHRGKYDSAAKAYRYLGRLGFKSIEAFWDDRLPQKLIGFAQRGDIVLDNDGIPAVCMGEYALQVAENVDGLQRIPPAQWAKAWAVG